MAIEDDELPEIHRAQVRALRHRGDGWPAARARAYLLRVAATVYEEQKAGPMGLMTEDDIAKLVGGALMGTADTEDGFRFLLDDELGWRTELGAVDHAVAEVKRAAATK